MSESENMITDEEFTLLHVIADIREALEVGCKPMLGELAQEVQSLKARHDCAMKVLNQIADMPHKTREQRLAKSCVLFLGSLNNG